MPNELNKEQLQRLARLGARARLAELEAERRAILRAFPGLAAPTARPAEAEGPGAPGKARRRRRKMSAAQKKAASERMKKYWAERKGKKAQA